jgi:hypothetical protein
MKLPIIKIITAVMLINSINQLNAQADQAIPGLGHDNTLFPGYYLGWSALTPFPLTIAHKGNLPMLFQTNSIQRMQINQNITTATTPAAGNQNKDGFVGINTTDPWSRLHITSSGTGVGAYGGYRPWMREGITMQNTNDQLWMGHRQWNPAQADGQNAVINWGDDVAAGPGPDHLIFNFTLSSFGGTSYPVPGIVPNPSELNGLEIMRLTELGRVGIGPRFSNIFVPQSTLHQHQENAASSWMQITNQFCDGTSGAVVGPTAISAGDGFRWGILGNTAQIQNGNAYIYNQENRHLIFSTNHTTPTDPFVTAERMRLTSIGAPTVLPTGGYGVYNPGTIANTDLTRMAISHNPLSPIQRPLSLLHLGYDPLGAFGNATVGWRPWMDVGMFVSSKTGVSGNTDNMYFGLKAEGTDRLDAVINWGNDVITNPFLGNGPDNFRFIFTGIQNTANGVNGLESMRLTPTDSGRHVFTGIGGDPATNPYFLGGINPTLTLEVNSPALTDSAIYSGMRFTDMTAAVTPLSNPGRGVLGLDSTGRVIYVNGGSGFGNICGAIPQNPLLNNWEIPLNQHNYVFSGQDTTTDRVGVGTICSPTAKFEVLNTTTFPGFLTRASKISALGTNGINIGMDLESSGSIQNIGLLMRVNNSTSNTSTIPNTSNGISVSMAGNLNRCVGIGVNIQAQNVALGEFIQLTTATNKDLIGLQINAFSSISTGTNLMTGIQSTANGASSNSAIRGYSGINTPGLYPAQSNVSLYGQSGNGLYNYSIYTDAPAPIGTTTVTNTNYAGFFNGGVYIAQTITASDELMKKDMIEISDALTKLNQLEAISFTFDQDLANDKGLSLPANLQYGFKAQQVGSIFPDLVSGVHKPEMLDSLGSVIKPAYDFKGVNYQGFIALLTKGIQEQQKTIDSLKTDGHNKDSIQDAQIQELKDMINACCQSQGNRGNMNNNNSSTIAQTDVELSNKDIVVLNQNVPNPFAEQTTITYNIPEKSGFAQIIFNDMKGQIIKVVDVKTKGHGQLNVFANDLSTGMYSYSLYVDGKLVDTKKMVKTE